MAGGGVALALQKRAAVWWDLNSCPVPDGVEPGRVFACVESALEKQMGRRPIVTMYAIGNLEFISSALLEDLSFSGIILIHAPCGGNSLGSLLSQWSPALATVMLISCDYSMVNHPFLFGIYGSSSFCAYPKDYRAPIFDYNVFAKEFVWETLLNDNMTTCGGGGEMTRLIVNQPPPCICDVCYDTFQTCAEFVTHLKSEEHIEELFKIAPRDPDSVAEARYFCQVCKYPAYNDYNLFLHNESEEHNRKKNLAEKMAQEEDLREQEEKSTSGSLERGKQEEVASKEEAEEEKTKCM